MYNVKSLVENLIEGSESDKEKAIKIHNFVRDNIRFGLTRKLDLASPEYTLENGYGHCNAKGVLFVRLLREAGINALHHFVTIKKDIFLDAFPYTIYSLFPPKISHSYVEVNINGKYIRTDSFCVEKALFLKLMSKLIDENRFCGYGININSKCDWDAKSDSFSQFHRNLLEEDHGTFENPLDYYYEYHSYKHQFFGIQFSIVLDMIGSMLNGQFEIWSNSVLNHYRSS
jgi:hypothetical protein